MYVEGEHATTTGSPPPPLLKPIKKRPYANRSLCLQIIAIDHSGRLLDAAIRIQKGKTLDIKGTRDLPCTIVPLDEIKANIERVQFQQVRCKDIIDF